MKIDGRAIRKLAESGWVAASSATTALTEADLPLSDVGYLTEVSNEAVWRAVEDAIRSLVEYFQTAQFFDATEFEPFFVSDPSRFDVRVPTPGGIRADQPEMLRPDFLDERISEGTNACEGADAWTPLVVVTLPAGLAMSSYDGIVDAPSEVFTMEDFDTRSPIIRQLRYALTSRYGREVPDSE